MMNMQDGALEGVKILRPKIHQDDRGYVTETAHEQTFAALGIPARFVQENQTWTREAGTVRGLHFQKAPHGQGKLLRVLKGRIYDVAVDLRPESKSFGQHMGLTLTEDEVVELFIPAGFAHGFCTLTDDVVILYKMTSFYAPESEGGLLWNDPDLKIDWPVEAGGVILSGKDEKWPRLQDLSPEERQTL